MVDRHDYAHWTAYNNQQAGRDVYDLCRTAMAVAGPGNGRTAIDLGCGAGIEARALAADGWLVYATDGEPGAAERLDRGAGGVAGAAERLDRGAGGVAGAGVVGVHQIEFKDFDFLPPVGLVHASYALPYMTRQVFDRVWRLIRAAARDVLAVDLFGVHDSWAGDPAMTFLTEAEVRGLFAGFAIEYWHEEDEPGEAFSEPKHWHIFSVVARRSPVG